MTEDELRGELSTLVACKLELRIAARMRVEDHIAALSAKLAKAKEALEDIARQHTGAEMGAEAAEDADFETAYEIMVDVARAALREIGEAQS